jgi:ribosome-associated translation inhibitor RaiA
VKDKEKVMAHVAEARRLRVTFETRNCTIPDDERARMAGLLRDLEGAFAELLPADVRFVVIFHPRSQTYHVEAKLRLPGETVFAGATDPYLDSAFLKCRDELRRRLEAYRAAPPTPSEEAARQRAALGEDVIAPTEPDAGPLGEAFAARDYARFRAALVPYEDWLRKRVGRWVQRYPAAQARVGDGLLIGDLVEEVYLTAFERFAERSRDVSVSQWLEGLIDPALRDLLHHADEEHQAASFARTVRTLGVGAEG